MSHDILKLEQKVELLKAKQKELLKHKTFLQLPEEKQLTFCRNNKALLSLSYELYLNLKKSNKPGDAFKAVSYFHQVWQLNHHKVLDEYRNCFKQKQKATLNPNQLSDDARELFTLYLCYLLDVGQQQNQANALMCLEKAARLDSPKAQATLGYLYFWGFGVKEDNIKALKWFRLAAEQKDTNADYWHGLLYKKGYGLEKKDINEAEKSFRKAAEKGHAAALHELAYLFDEEYPGNKKDKKQAVILYQLVVEQGFAISQNNLGWMYAEGEVVSQDFTLGARLFRQAAEQGNDKTIEDNLPKYAKKHRIMAFHLAMIHCEDKKIIQLINKKPSLIKELIWDLKRPQENKTRYQHLLSLIEQILDDKNVFKKSPRHTTALVINFLSHHVQNNNLDARKISLINLLSISSIKDKDKCIEFIQLLSDTWYNIKEGFGKKMHDAFTQQAAELLSKSIYRLKLMDKKINDTGLLLQSAHVLIQGKYGHKYEVSFSQKFSFNDLLIFLALSKRNISIEKMNKILGMNLIKPVFTDHKALLNQLMKYLSVKDVTKNAPTLKALKRKLINDWKEIQNPSEQKAVHVLTELCQGSKEALEITKKNPKTFFAIKNDNAKELFYMLAQEQHNELYQLLKASLPKVRVDVHKPLVNR